MSILTDFIKKFRGQKDHKIYADILNNRTPIFSMYGQDIFVSDVVRQAIDCIVLELKKDADVENLKNMLLKKTKLEDTFGVNMLAVADGRPETLGLRDIIRHHVDFSLR